jgi:hypothetical protein
MKKPKIPPAAEDRPALTAYERETRDNIATSFMLVCAADLSRDISTERVSLLDVDRAIIRISHLSYFMADAMLKARDAK